MTPTLAAIPAEGLEPVRIETRRGPVECIITGEGPAVICLHGAMGGCDQSLLLAQTVGAPGFRYLAVSRPGYLGTAMKLGGSPEAQADLYAVLLDALGIETAAVMAVSGGGYSALHFALRHPGRCWGLVLVSTTAGPVPNKLPLRFQLLKLLSRRPGFSRRAAEKLRQDPDKAAAPSIRDPEVRARTVRDPEAGPLLLALQLSTMDRMHQRIAGTENDVAVTRTHSYPLEEIRVPTLVIHGTEDLLVPYEQHGKVLAARIPGAELLTVEGGEHVSIFTDRDRCQARVAAFLKDRAPRPA